jgi:hypothetical protein
MKTCLNRGIHARTTTSVAMPRKKTVEKTAEETQDAWANL